MGVPHGCTPWVYPMGYAWYQWWHRVSREFNGIRGTSQGVTYDISHVKD